MTTTILVLAPKAMVMKTGAVDEFTFSKVHFSDEENDRYCVWELAAAHLFGGHPADYDLVDTGDEGVFIVANGQRLAQEI